MSDLESQEQEVLEQLAQRFLAALRRKDAGEIDDAEDALRDILKVEPRLAEPRMELARILLDTDRVSDAEPHAREALTHLEAAGPWTEDLPDNVVLAVAHGLLAEILRRRAESDEVLFGNPDTFHALIAESKAHFHKAAELDPDDAFSSYHAVFMGPPAQS